MGLRTPAFRVEAGGADVTRLIEENLIALRVTLTSDRASDTLEIELSNADGRLAVPAAERELRVSLGYKGSPLVPMGVYYHDESEVQLSPRRLTIRATAADLRRRSTLKAPRRRAWDDVSLGDLVATIAAEHGYRASVAPELAGVVIAHVDQTAESDLHLLRRLARQYDATAKAVGGHLVFAPRGSGRSAASGQVMPVVEYVPADRAAPADRRVLTARYTVKGRPRYGSVVTTYQDVQTAELVHVRAGEDAPVFEVREPYPDRPQALAAAQARLARYARQTRELEMSVSGNPVLASEAVLVLRGWPDPAGSRWTALRVGHAVSKQRGYVTNVTGEPFEE